MGQDSCDAGTVWSALEAIGTLSAVVVALFGDRIAGWLWQPKLQVTLNNPAGTRTWLESEGKNALYFHLRVENTRAVKAENVTVMVTRVEQGSERDGFECVFRDVPVPLAWPFHEPRERDVYGHMPELCDLGRLVQGGEGFYLSAKHLPNNFPNVVRPGMTTRYALCVWGSNFKVKDEIVIQIHLDRDKWTGPGSSLSALSVKVVA